MEETRKLKLVKYNKNLQNILNLNLINYKRQSGRYIIYEKDQKNIGREFDSYTNEILFKGEYLNGERNGKGKEYYEDGKLKFEGEYLNGKRNGKGKEYYDDGRLKFEGEYLYGYKVLK